MQGAQRAAVLPGFPAATDALPGPCINPQGPQLYYVDNDATRLKAKDTMPYFSVGSGSMYAYGVLDTKCVCCAKPPTV